MTEIPEPNHSITALIDEAYEKRQEGPRPHLGASLLGHSCDRWLWLSFRWAVVEKFKGRTLRIFKRGQEEEQRIKDDLAMIGITVHGEQDRVDFGNHVSGSSDGSIHCGVPGATKTEHVVEMKTHNKKSMDDLEKNGVKKSKPMHWCQMQVYMRGLNMTRALYYAVCKDDDRIYTERVDYDAAAARQLVERGHRIVSAERMPDPLTTDPTWYECKWCAAHSFCHKRQLTEQVNCRTCAHATADEDSTWSCARWDSKGIPVEFQRTGCDSHVLHPDMVPWPMKDSGSPHEAVYEIDGVDVRNGEGDAHVFSSKELIAGGEACAHELVRGVKEVFPSATVETVKTIEETF